MISRTQPRFPGKNMLAIPLRLHPAARPLPVCAGWLPVADPLAWLVEARRIAAVSAHAVVKFYPLATSAQDQTASGVVITVDGEVPSLDAVFGPQVQRLGEALPGVLVPIHARVEPTLTDAGRQRLFPWAVHFIHPVLGLTGFGEGDAVLPWQLLAAPRQEQAGWFAAVPGPPAPPPLRQLALVQESSFGELLAGDGDDIGSQRPDKDGAPSGSSLLEKAGGMAAGMFGALGSSLLGALGSSKAAAGLDTWSRRQKEDLQDRRQKELNKLLDRFDKDTLDALRHAIPLTGAGARRGSAATPGWKLGMRNPELTASSQGGGVVDVWEIASGTRLKLEQRYREAAAREAAAGQWGRAAYIYGELLGDWNKAAAMLENGGRPREAARIYAGRLRSGLRAAQCLEKAGLLAEAAALFHEAGHPEKAGDLMAALRQPEAARGLWESALAGLTNPLEQARLLETKLRDPGRALTALRTGWPASGQALPCFEGWFALLGRLGRHQTAAACLGRLEQDPAARLQPASAMAAGLQTLFSQYPDSALRDHAATLAPHLIGEALATGPSRAESGRLLALLPRFSPGDRLLARDAERFSLTKHRPAVPLLVQTQVTVLRADHVIPLDPEVRWESIADSPQGPHVVGWRQERDGETGHLSLMAGAILHGQSPQRQAWPAFPMGPPRFHHVVCGVRKPFPLIHSRAHQLAAWQAPPNHPSNNQALAAGLGSDGEFLLLCLSETGTLLAGCYGADGNFRRSRVLDFAPPGMANGDWFTGGHGRDLWIAGMDVVCCATEKSGFQHVALNGPITAFAVAPPVLPSQAIAVGAGEAVLLIRRGAGKSMECVNLYSGTARLPPVAAFTGDGRAVIADANGGMAYHPGGSCLKQADIVIPPGSGELIAATAIGAHGFAFLTSTGKVLGYG